MGQDALGCLFRALSWLLEGGQGGQEQTGLAGRQCILEYSREHVRTKVAGNPRSSVVKKFRKMKTSHSVTNVHWAEEDHRRVIS